MLWPGEKVRRRRHFENIAAVDKHHPVGNFARELHLMRHDYHGNAAVRQLLHDQQHFADHFRIERRGGLIEKNNLRRRGEGAGNGHALLLAAGELGRHLAGFILQPDLLQQRQRAFARGGFFPAVHALQRQGDIFLRRQMGIEVELLENKAHAAA